MRHPPLWESEDKQESIAQVFQIEWQNDSSETYRCGYISIYIELMDSNDKIIFDWTKKKPQINKNGQSRAKSYFLKTNKGLEKDRCRDSMEAILTNGVKCVGRGLFTSKLERKE
ncbi:hypothetical protein H5410_002504 [Solanum commersonii]|uniref:Uncharacterized protein n=1 Tax=Solanum commersonii TaxID=4109 RepID=A0A9J6B2G2_SOLCO|nr:hypothetical protein H5410_002504 [Solanum commersonii]